MRDRFFYEITIKFEFSVGRRKKDTDTKDALLLFVQCFTWANVCFVETGRATLFSFRLELNLVFYFIPDSRTNARNDALDRPTPNVMHTSCLNVQLGNKHLFFYMYPSWSFVGHFTRVIEDWTSRIGQTLFRVLYLLAQKVYISASVSFPVRVYRIPECTQIQSQKVTFYNNVIKNRKSN